MINIDTPRRKRETPFQEKLARLGASLLPAFGTALGSFGGPGGAMLGGSLGGLAQGGIQAMMPQQNMYEPQQQQPMVFGEESPDMFQIPGQNEQMQMQNPGMQQFGANMGNQMGNMGLQGIMSLLNPQATAQQSLMGKMDGTLREKLVRMMAMKQMMGV